MERSAVSRLGGIATARSTAAARGERAARAHAAAVEAGTRIARGERLRTVDYAEARDVQVRRLWLAFREVYGVTWGEAHRRAAT